MHDVGRLAGVSQSTVSLVVNNNPSVAPETRERVNRAIQALGFRANRSAQNLRGLPSRTIGFVTNQMATTPLCRPDHPRRPAGGLEAGYVLLVVDVGDSTELTDSAIDILVDQDVSGFIYASMTPIKVYIPPALHQVPSSSSMPIPRASRPSARSRRAISTAASSRPGPCSPPATGASCSSPARPTTS